MVRHCSFQNKGKAQLRAVQQQQPDRSTPTCQIWLSLHQLPQAQKGASRAYPVLHRAAQWVNKPTWPSRPSCANAGSCFSPSCQAFGACFTTWAGRSTCHRTLKPGTFGGRSETKAATRAVPCRPPGVLLSRACSMWGQPGCYKTGTALPGVPMCHFHAIEKWCWDLTATTS